MEASTSVPASHGVHPSERGLLQGIQVFLVKAEDHETHVLQGNQNMQTHHTTCLGKCFNPKPSLDLFSLDLGLK